MGPSASHDLGERSEQDYPEQIRATAKDTIEFYLKPATDLKPWQSKVGGVPYYPLDMEYPCTSTGVPLTFLVQINFSETPRLEMLPEKGILVFFIDAKNTTLGADIKDGGLSQDGFRVIYFETIEQDESKLRKDVMGGENQELYRGFDEYGNVKHDRNPIKGNCSYAIDKFLVKKQYITSCDYHFDSMDCDEYGPGFIEGGHRLGGYPCFTQDDPRGYTDSFRDYELLLQIDSDWSSNHKYVMWGDAGVGTFFIHPEDLKKCDFSKVYYYWDCY